MPPDGGPGWEILGEVYPANPRLGLPAWCWDMVRLWRLFATGMGTGFLPDPGGLMDQPCTMLDAFALMAAAERELKGDE